MKKKFGKKFWRNILKQKCKNKYFETKICIDKNRSVKLASANHEQTSKPNIWELWAPPILEKNDIEVGAGVLASRETSANFVLEAPENCSYHKEY